MPAVIFPPGGIFGEHYWPLPSPISLNVFSPVSPLSCQTKRDLCFVKQLPSPRCYADGLPQIVVSILCDFLFPPFFRSASLLPPNPLPKRTFRLSLASADRKGILKNITYSVRRFLSFFWLLPASIPASMRFSLPGVSFPPNKISAHGCKEALQRILRVVLRPRFRAPPPFLSHSFSFSSLSVTALSIQSKMSRSSSRDPIRRFLGIPHTRSISRNPPSCILKYEESQFLTI